MKTEILRTLEEKNICYSIVREVETCKIPGVEHTQSSYFILCSFKDTAKLMPLGFYKNHGFRKEELISLNLTDKQTASFLQYDVKNFIRVEHHDFGSVYEQKKQEL